MSSCCISVALLWGEIRVVREYQPVWPGDHKPYLMLKPGIKLLLHYWLVRIFTSWISGWHTSRILFFSRKFWTYPIVHTSTFFFLTENETYRLTSSETDRYCDLQQKSYISSINKNPMNVNLQWKLVEEGMLGSEWGCCGSKTYSFHLIALLQDWFCPRILLYFACIVFERKSNIS